MKKFLALLLTLILVFALVACDTTKDDDDNDDKDTTPSETESVTEAPAFDPSKKSEGVMTYAEFMAAEINAEVTVEAFVQGHQSWWSDKITVYAQDLDGGYFFYELACSEADAAKLVPGTRIKVKGTKGEWGGEIEITIMLHSLTVWFALCPPIQIMSRWIMVKESFKLLSVILLIALVLMAWVA